MGRTIRVKQQAEETSNEGSMGCWNRADTLLKRGELSGADCECAQTIEVFGVSCPRDPVELKDLEL